MFRWAVAIILPSAISIKSKKKQNKKKRFKNSDTFTNAINMQHYVNAGKHAVHIHM